MNTESARQKCGTLSDEPVVHRIASSGLIVVMPYITVRNTPNSLGTSKTYIDFANASGSSSLKQLEGEIVSSLGASIDHRLTLNWSGSCTYSTVKSPHEVLNVLEGFGYRVVAAVTYAVHAIVWTLHKQG